jgi:hypothetical protein
MSRVGDANEGDLGEDDESREWQRRPSRWPLHVVTYRPVRQPSCNDGPLVEDLMASHNILPEPPTKGPDRHQYHQ